MGFDHGITQSFTPKWWFQPSPGEPLTPARFTNKNHSKSLMEPLEKELGNLKACMSFSAGAGVANLCSKSLESSCQTLQPARVGKWIRMHQTWCKSLLSRRHCSCATSQIPCHFDKNLGIYMLSMMYPYFMAIQHHGEHQTWFSATTPADFWGHFVGALWLSRIDC